MAQPFAVYVSSSANAPFRDTFATGAATPTLFRSIGNDATGTLSNAWTQDSGSWTIAANVVTSPASATAIMHAGHPSWTDYTFFSRVEFFTNAKPQAIVHFADTSNFIYAEIDGSALTLYKVVGGSTTSIATTFRVALNATWYWFEIICSGTTYTVNFHLEGAPAGTMSATVSATVSGTIGDAILQAGPIGFRGGTATSYGIGGAFSNVCYVTGPATTGWTPGAAWTTDEPAFAWFPPGSGLAPQPGRGVLSIYLKTAYTNALNWSQAITRAAGTYQIGASMKGFGVTPFVVISGPVIATGNSTGVWEDFASSGSVTVNPTITLSFPSASTGTIYFSNVTLLGDVVDQTGNLLYGSLTMKRNTFDFTLTDPSSVPSLGSIVLTHNPWWMTGIVGGVQLQSLVSLTEADVVDLNTGHHWAICTAANTDALPSAMPAPFGLSSSPDNSTTYGYRSLSIQSTIASDGTHAFLGTCELFQPGLFAGMTFALTSANLLSSGTVWTITQVTIRWGGLKVPIYKIEFGTAASARTLTGVAP